MYFCNYIYKGTECLGVLTEDGQQVVPISDLLLKITGKSDIQNLKDMFGNCTVNIPTFKLELANYIATSGDKIIPLNEVELTAPISTYNDILCLGKNYAAHAKELGGSIFDDTSIPQYPIYFTKRANSVQDPEGAVYYDPEFTTQLDYEAELAVIIGKEARNIEKEDVEEYIFGYTIINDISARDVQHQHKQWFRGKSYETYCPMGPYILHASAVEFPPKLNITCRVNGEVRQQDNTSSMIFDIPTVVSELSKTFTLKPGDVISTGTPAGVGMGFDPPKFLTPGDVVECEIEKIGILRNKIVDISK